MYVLFKLANAFGNHTCTQTTNSVILDMTALLAMCTPRQTANPLPSRLLSTLSADLACNLSPQPTPPLYLSRF